MKRSTLLRAGAIGLAWLMVLAPTAGLAGPTVDASATDAPTRAMTVAPPSPTNNTSARLQIPTYRIGKSRFETVTVGAASTLQAGAFGARSEHRRIAIEQAFESADSFGERHSAIDRALAKLSARAKAIENYELTVIRGYSNGTISTESIVRQLALIDARARGLSIILTLIRNLTDRIETPEFDARLRGVEGTLMALQGPVRNQVALALEGNQRPVRVNVVASEQALIFSTLIDGNYLREATDWGNRDADGPSQLDFGEVTTRVKELYPWATRQNGATSIDWQGAGAWRFQTTHPQGRLTASIDASTADVYREVQRTRTTDMPTAMTIVRTRGGFRIGLQRTYPGGPLRIIVEDASMDAVVNAKVAVDGHELGRIGGDSGVMTLEPRLPYTVNVTDDGSSVVLVVERPLNAS
jgi:hypothetical protein